MQHRRTRFGATHRITPHSRLLGDNRRKNVACDVGIFEIVGLVGRGHERERGQRFVVHTHTARRTAFKNNVGETGNHLVHPIKVCLRAKFQPFPCAKGKIIRTHAAIFVVVEFDIFRTVIFHHSANGFRHIRAHFFISVVQEITVHHRNLTPVSLQETIVVVISKHFFALNTDDFRFNPKPRFHTERTDEIGRRPYPMRETGFAFLPLTYVRVDLVARFFVVPTAIDDVIFHPRLCHNGRNQTGVFFRRAIPRKVHIFVKDGRQVCVYCRFPRNFTAVFRHLAEYAVQAFAKRQRYLYRRVFLPRKQFLTPTAEG